MMTGAVSADLEPRLRLTVRDVRGRPHEVDTVIDTGFNGSLTLPPVLVAALGLPWLCRQQGQLADGSVLTFDVYSATVDWHGRPRVVEIEATGARSLLGTALMQGSDLRIRMEPGGAAQIDEVP